ncbi:OmpA family protein [Elizabethkingia anophelis]|uniref:OmpA family protein n=1 Tax=Elizabethkingia anophelis TaxID=1117645 RepID=UPI00099A7E92|nr:OmpA family protein [Elizabethkingia anophelis]MCT4329507.1 OmpA family protein [Elizabethkingia anophelis]OPC44370.1 flagellar motor protein MotB [Elizabethkingia anophelis]
MSVNIIDLVKNYLSPGVVSQTATQLGESESGVSKAISAFLPVLVGGIADKAGSTPGLLDQLKGLASSGILSSLGSGSGSGNSVVSGIISSIFGDKIGGILSSVSSFAGIKESSAQSLLGLTSDATLGTIGKYAADNNLDESGFTNLLSGQKSWISSLLPAGLSLGALGLGGVFSGLGEKAEDVKEAVTEKIEDIKNVFTGNDEAPEVTRSGNTYTPPPAGNNGGGGSVWKWLLPLILLGLIGWFLWKQCKAKEDSTTTVTTTESTASDTGSQDSAKTTTTTTTKETTTIDVKGTSLQGFKGGMEESMVNFLNSGKYATTDDEALKTTWYNFDNVNFVIGKADKLEAGSEGQIQNIATILKAFPDAKIKIGGYTDKTGNEAGNLKLSQDRANFIKAELTKLGVGGQILEAKGYGSEHATVAATASNEERAVDRKMAVRFAK